MRPKIEEAVRLCVAEAHPESGKVASVVCDTAAEKMERNPSVWIHRMMDVGKAQWIIVRQKPEKFAIMLPRVGTTTSPSQVVFHYWSICHGTNPCKKDTSHNVSFSRKPHIKKG